MGGGGDGGRGRGRGGSWSTRGGDGLEPELVWVSRACFFGAGEFELDFTSDGCIVKND